MFLASKTLSCITRVNSAMDSVRVTRAGPNSAVQGKSRAGQQQAAVARIQQQRNQAQQQGAATRLGGSNLSQAARSAIASAQAAG